MTNRNGRRGWLAGAVLLLLAVCALVVPAAPAQAAAAMPCHEPAAMPVAMVPNPGAGPIVILTAGERGRGDARHHAGICTVAVCPLMHAALLPAAFPGVQPVAAAPVAAPFLPLQRGIGVPPPLPPPRSSI